MIVSAASTWGVVAILIVVAAVLVLLLYVTRRERNVGHHPVGSRRDERAAPGAQGERGVAAARDESSEEERFPGGAGTR